MDPSQSKISGPLSGMRIIDLTSVVMGPYCTQILCDLGAEVIKIENADGDPTRHLGPTRRPLQSGMFININRGKKSVVIDLKQQEGRDLCLRLMSTADAVVHSMRPAAIKRLGLTYEDVRQHNPEIIYANLYGFGRKGRYANLPAYDDTIQAVSGMSMLQSHMVGEPQYTATVLGDKLCGVAGAYAVMAAMIFKLRSGKGQEVEIPMFETMASFLLVEHMSGAVFNPPLGPPMYERVILPDRKPFKTQTGYLAVIIHNDKQWRNFTKVLNRDDLASDERFTTQAGRSKNTRAFYEITSAIFLEKSAEEWKEILEQAEVPVAELNSLEDLFSDPHMEDVGFFREVDDHPDGPVRLPVFPITFSESPATFNAIAPELGQHTRELLGELKINNEEITALSQKNIIQFSHLNAAE